MENAKAAASGYLLSMLLQRMENYSPGTISEMIDGLNGDKKSASPDDKDAEYVAEIFEESLAVLKRAAA